MKSNSFLHQSKILMKVWILFVGIWLSITIFQSILGFKATGYASLFTKPSATGSERFIALMCMILYGCWSVVEIVKCKHLLDEYKEFIKSIDKPLEVKQTLYQIKVCLIVIIVGSAFFLMAGMMNHFNWIWFLIMLLVKFYYASKFKKLVNLIGYIENAVAIVEK